MRYKRGHSRTEFFCRVWMPPPPSPPSLTQPRLVRRRGRRPEETPNSPYLPLFPLPVGVGKRSETSRIATNASTATATTRANGPLFPHPFSRRCWEERKEGGIIYLPLREKEALASFLVSSPLLLAAARSSVKGEINCVSLLLLLLRYHKKSFPLPTSAFFLSNHHHGLAGKISGFGFGRLPF